MNVSALQYTVFQSTLPVRGATYPPARSSQWFLYFNPRSPCGERRLRTKYSDIMFTISIHAPRAGSDAMDGSLLKDFLMISIHAPRAGSDGKLQQTVAPGRISIHAPRAGSDTVCATKTGATSDFNPRSPCGERHLRRKETAEGGEQFQSTLPVRGATASPLSSHISV